MSTILGVRVDNIRMNELEHKLLEMLRSGKPHKIFTPNSEMVLLAQKDTAFMEILNRADLAVPDSTGLMFASIVLETETIHERITGVDTLKLLAILAHREGKRLYLLGGVQWVAEGAAENLRKALPGLQIHAHSGGPIWFADGEWHMNPMLLQEINALKPDILAVALGHKKQEHWIDAFLPLLPSVKIAIGVGGAFNYISGTTERAPKWMRKYGLEWLYRLIREPKRLPRIVNAVVVFPFTVIWAKMKSHK